LWAAGQQAEPLWTRLDPSNRARVLLALLVLVLLGSALILLVWLGGRYMRRVTAKPLAKVRPPDERWYQKPLNPSDAPPGGAGNAE
jgi:hypothetical protein